MSIFDRRHRSSAAVTPVRYGHEICKDCLDNSQKWRKLIDWLIGWVPPTPALSTPMPQAAGFCPRHTCTAKPTKSQQCCVMLKKEVVLTAATRQRLRGPLRLAPTWPDDWLLYLGLGPRFLSFAWLGRRWLFLPATARPCYNTVTSEYSTSKCTPDKSQMMSLKGFSWIHLNQDSKLVILALSQCTGKITKPLAYSVSSQDPSFLSTAEQQEKSLLIDGLA